MGRDGGGSKTQVRERRVRRSIQIEQNPGESVYLSLSGAANVAEAFS
jgi:hypothetical protein